MQTCVCIIHSILFYCVSATAVSCENKMKQWIYPCLTENCTRIFLSSLWTCPGVSRNKMLAHILKSLSKVGPLWITFVFPANPTLINLGKIAIWGILRPSQHTETFFSPHTFKAFLKNGCSMAGQITPFERGSSRFIYLFLNRWPKQHPHERQILQHHSETAPLQKRQGLQDKSNCLQM